MENVDDVTLTSQQWSPDQQQLNGDHRGAAKGVLQYLMDTHGDLAEPSDAAEKAQADPDAPTVKLMNDPLSPGAPTASAITASTSNGAAKVNKKKAFMSRFSSVSAKIPQEHRDRIAVELQGAKNSILKQFPNERRDQIVYRLSKV